MTPQPETTFHFLQSCQDNLQQNITSQDKGWPNLHQEYSLDKLPKYLKLGNVEPAAAKLTF